MSWRVDMGFCILAACAPHHARPVARFGAGPAYPVLRGVMVPERVTPRGVSNGTTTCSQRLFLLELTAIEEFEADNDLDVTGEMTGATLAKLVEVHGS